MKQRYRPLIHAWIIFLISEIFAALIIYNLVFFDFIRWAEEEVSKAKPTRSNHIWIMAATMIILNGHGMVIFRLLPRVKTSIIKHIHAIIHSVVIIGAIYGYYVMHVLLNENDRPHFSFDHLHISLVVLTAIVYFIQWLVGVFVYLYLYSNQRRRKLFASWHNFIGICILQLSIATACVQLYELDYGLNIGTLYAEAAIVCMVTYGVLINSIVLNPYLEWRLVGPL